MPPKRLTERVAYVERLEVQLRELINNPDANLSKRLRTKLLWGMQNQTIFPTKELDGEQGVARSYIIRLLLDNRIPDAKIWNEIHSKLCIFKYPPKPEKIKDSL